MHRSQWFISIMYTNFLPNCVTRIENVDKYVDDQHFSLSSASGSNIPIDGVLL